MSKYRNIKIHVPTPEISEKVQVELAKHGCRRSGNKEMPANLNIPYIYVGENGTVAYTLTSEVYGFLNDEQEVPYQSILDPYYDVKIAWANGETVQREIETDDGEKWVDWHDSDSLDIDCGYDWRIKPKTKTIKQWEYKKTIFEGEEVYTVVFRHKALAMESYRDCGTAITEPTLVEYEVPND